MPVVDPDLVAAIPWTRVASALRILRGAWLPAVMLLSACAGHPAKGQVAMTTEVVDATTKFELVYVLQAGDQLEVSVYRHPELSRKPVIRPDGFISMPLLGDIKAADKTPGELASHLTARFGERIRQPEVSVMVENPPEPVVYVLGDVGVTRSVPLRQAKNVAQALALASSSPRSAAISRVSVIRLNDQGIMEAHTVEASGRTRAELYMALNAMALKPNDLVIIPESYRSQVVRVFQDMVTVISPYFQLRILDDQVGLGL